MVLRGKLRGRVGSRRDYFRKPATINFAAGFRFSSVSDLASSSRNWLSSPLTDLLTVFFGLGVFTANAAFSFQQWTNTATQGWQTERRGYLGEEEIGYALALFALLRGEHNPAWANILVAV